MVCRAGVVESMLRFRSVWEAESVRGVADCWFVGWLVTWLLDCLVGCVSVSLAGCLVCGCGVVWRDVVWCGVEL